MSDTPDLLALACNVIDARSDLARAEQDLHEMSQEGARRHIGRIQDELERAEVAWEEALTARILLVVNARVVELLGPLVDLTGELRDKVHETHELVSAHYSAKSQ